MLFENLSIAAFRANFYKQRPLLVRGGAPQILGRQYGYSDFAAWRATMEQHYPSYMRVDGERMVAVLRASTIVPELAAVAARIDRSFPEVICAFDTFYTGQEEGGSVGAHFDDNDNIILQQAGKKRWKVSPPAYVHPGSAHARACENAQIGPVVMPDEQLEFELEPGDALYVPSFWIHWGVGLGRSLSVSLAMNPRDTASLLHEHPMWPRVQAHLTQRARRTPVQAAESASSLLALEHWVRSPVPSSARPTVVARVDLEGLVETSARTNLAALLTHVAWLPKRAISNSVSEGFVRALAGVGRLPEPARSALLASNLFACVAERSVEATVFADPYQLEELGEVLTGFCAEVIARGHLSFDALLALARPAHSLHELRHATTTHDSWQALLGAAPDLAALGMRALPVIGPGPDAVVSERAYACLGLRLGTQAAAPSACASREEALVHALGRRCGRALAEALPAFSEPVVERMLPALALDELAPLSDFCESFGYLTGAWFARCTQAPELARARTEQARLHAERAQQDARMTEPARTLLRAALTPRLRFALG